MVYIFKDGASIYEHKTQVLVKLFFGLRKKTIAYVGYIQYILAVHQQQHGKLRALLSLRTLVISIFVTFVLFLSYALGAHRSNGVTWTCMQTMPFTFVWLFVDLYY